MGSDSNSSYDSDNDDDDEFVDAFEDADPVECDYHRPNGVVIR